ncbi:MAG: hypothetical protein NVSMB46_07970 [Candidatus Saccharimonadales bacterium]
MNRENWVKQSTDQATYSQLLWSRPENKILAGRLLIIGGNKFSFSAPAEAFTHSIKAGVGRVRIILPDALKKIVGPSIEGAEFAPCTPSGSFSTYALAEFLDQSEWSEGILLAGDFGRNSETAVLLEKFAVKTTKPLIITKDSVDYLITINPTIMLRDKTTLVLSFSQLQKIARHCNFSMPFTFSMDYLHLIECLQKFTSHYSAALVVEHVGTIFVAYKGKVSTTKLPSSTKIWRVVTASNSAVWLIQNSKVIFEALTTAMYASFYSDNID